MSLFLRFSFRQPRFRQDITELPFQPLLLLTDIHFQQYYAIIIHFRSLRQWNSRHAVIDAAWFRILTLSLYVIIRH